MRKGWQRTAAAVLTLGIVATACGSGGGASGGAYGAGAGGASSPSAGAPGSSGGYHYGSGGGSSSSGGAIGAGAASVLMLTQVNYRFTPAKITVHQGDTITVSDTNPSTPHTFTIDGTDIDVSNNPQQSQDITIDVKPGTYAFFCRFHRSMGMEGTLVVT